MTTHNTDLMPIIIKRENVRKSHAHLQLWSVFGQYESVMTCAFGKN